jgi:hypothetical protein
MTIVEQQINRRYPLLSDQKSIEEIVLSNLPEELVQEDGFSLGDPGDITYRLPVVISYIHGFQPGYFKIPEKESMIKIAERMKNFGCYFDSDKMEEFMILLGNNIPDPGSIEELSLKSIRDFRQSLYKIEDRQILKAIETRYFIDLHKPSYKQ